MEFAIKLNNPQSKNTCEVEDETISDVIESIFPLETEDAILVWNNIDIILNYKYDISVIFDDILWLIYNFINSPSGETSIAWPSNTFRTDWQIAWSNEQVEVIATWDCVVGGTDNLLNASPKISVNKLQFLGEWCGLIELILMHLQKITLPQSIDLSRLENVLDKVPNRGILYQ